MKVNIYMLVFGVIALVIILAAISMFVFSRPGANAQNGGAAAAANLPNYGSAPDIQGVSGWINSGPINLTKLKGKVVLIDFWTYSCINCIRTIPHLNAWYNEYGNNGLVIIGIHTPEFAFEKNYTNVLNAAHQYAIKYPVALDNDYSTWIAYNNHYWPADYIIDKNGDIRAEQFGEGDYNTTEQIIRELLVNASYTVPNHTTNVSVAVNFSQIGSPEMYLGYQEIEQQGRTDYFGNAQGLSPGNVVNYTLSNISRLNTIYLSGEWYNAPDSMVAEGNSKLVLIYSAEKVNVVASDNGTNTSIAVTLDGHTLNQTYIGSDTHIVNGAAVVDIGSPRLYNIVSGPSYGIHEVEITSKPNFRIYTFTFG